MDILLVQNENLIKIADAFRKQLGFEDKLSFPTGYIDTIDLIYYLLSEI